MYPAFLPLIVLLAAVIVKETMLTAFYSQTACALGIFSLAVKYCMHRMATLLFQRKGSV